jgi:hypothetical protein
MTACSVNQPSIPNGMVGWGFWNGTTSCSAAPTIISAYTTGCTTLPGAGGVGAQSFSLTCQGNDLKVSQWISTGACASNPTLSVQYNFGCASATHNGYSAAVKQIGCQNGGVSINWIGFFQAWARIVGAWTVAAWNNAVTNFYQSHGTITYSYASNGATVSVAVTFTGPTDPVQVQAFVTASCSQMLQKAIQGVCQQEISGLHCSVNPTPLQQDTCTFTVTASAKRSALDTEQMPTAITIQQGVSSTTSSGMATQPQFLLMLAALFLFFLRTKFEPIL